MNEKIYDVAVIGAGGAGLTAAVYSSRANMATLVIEKMAPGGQIATTDLVENYPGFPEGILGPDISIRMEEQARKYGSEMVYEEVLNIARVDTVFQIRTSVQTYSAKSVILAMGASFRKLGIPGEKEFTGKGVSYCATCDGAFFKNKKIAVVGGGDSALQEGIFLTRFASSVTVIHRRDQLRASPILQERARKNGKISFIWDTVIEKIHGERSIRSLDLKNVKTGDQRRYDTEGLFIFIGHDPNSGFLKGFVELSPEGYVLASSDFKASVDGVFAAGEIRAGAVRQLVAACGEGCGAALAAQAYLEHLV